MICYSYECPQCLYQEEIFHGMHEKKRPPCPACKEKIMIRITTSAPAGFVKNRTIGALADENSSKMSDEQKKSISVGYTGPLPEGGTVQKDKQRKSQWYDKFKKKTNAEVRKMTDIQRKTYIEEGK